MSNQILAACALLGGVLTGLLFFGGLWWTVQKAMFSKQPGLLFAGSFLLRTLLSLAAFYLIGSGSWQRLLLCLIGFILGRILVGQLTKVFLAVDRGLFKEGAQ